MTSTLLLARLKISSLYGLTVESRTLLSMVRQLKYRTDALVDLKKAKCHPVEFKGEKMSPYRV